jgi:hypothetical protein
MNLTIAYITSRRESKFEWFIGSLQRQIVSGDQIRLIIISHQLWYGQSPLYFESKINQSLFESVVISEPKPTVWCGPHKLTVEDWFSASSTRNTALCLAPDGYIAFVDDLSVLLPGWLDHVRAAMAGGYIVCGTYAKAKDMVVENGFCLSHTDYPQGHDSRERFAPTDLHPCEGGWLFGCSCAMPVEALLTIGGWTEFADGLGSEDYLTGLTLQNAGFKLMYDKKMKTLESEELHHLDKPLRKTDKGKSPDDKSHRALNIVLSGQKFFDNYYEGGIRAERERVLRGEPFTIRNNPQHDWYDSQPISEMT